MGRNIVFVRELLSAKQQSSQQIYSLTLKVLVATIDALGHLETG